MRGRRNSGCGNAKRAWPQNFRTRVSSSVPHPFLTRLATMNATTVGIYESSGYLCKSHWYKSQQIFTQFVTKFCSGRHLASDVTGIYKSSGCL